jgi:aerotaxis receptor
MDTSFDMFIETQVPENELIISRTDLNGVITYVNDTFADISGYEADELVGKAHNIVRHPDMPSSVFSDLWQTIKDGKTWDGYVKNLRKDGGYYWVFAEISGVYKNGELVEFKSMRSPVERDMKIEMQGVYDDLRRDQGELQRVVVYLSADQIQKVEEAIS